MAQINATTYGERIKNEITDGIEITDTLEQVIISENGEFHQFDTIAKNLMSDSIESMQLAPNGIITDIYPAEGNEAGKIDLLHEDRKEISCYNSENSIGGGTTRINITCRYGYCHHNSHSCSDYHSRNQSLQLHYTYTS